MATTYAPSSHVGATGNAHGVATATGHGFMSRTDKAKLDGIAPGATSTPLSSDVPAALGVASAGSATQAARADHVHAAPTATEVGAVTSAEVDARIQAAVNAAPDALATLQQLSDALGDNGDAVASLTTALAGKAPIDHAHAAADVGALTAAETDARIQAVTDARIQPVVDMMSAQMPASHVGATGNAHGVATTAVNGFMSRTDKAKLDGIAAGATSTPLSLDVPAGLGVAVTGTANSAARADHVHARPTAADVGAVTSAEVDARIQSAVNAAPDALATLQQLSDALGDNGDAVATLTATLAGKAAIDHAHSAADVGALTVAETDARIQAVTDARIQPVVDMMSAQMPASHVGATGNAHGVASTAANGFMSKADKAKLDGVAAGATSTPLSSAPPAALGVAAAGVDGSAARADHVHPMPTAADVGAVTPAEVDARIQGVVGTAPAALDTLKELAEALGDDADFAGTVTTALAGKAAVGHAHTPGDIGAAPVVHGHAADEITGLGDAAVRDVGTTAGTVAAGDDGRLAMAGSSLQQGRHTAFWPGDAIKTAPTNGCTAGQETEVSGQPPIAGADFDPATEQYGRLVGATPKSADGGAIDVMLTWNRVDAAGGSFGVASSVRAAYLVPGAARPNWSAWVELGAVALGVQNQDQATAYAPVTPAGTATGTGTSEAILMLEVRRKAADAADTLAVKARLTGCFIRYSVTAATDA